MDTAKIPSFFTDHLNRLQNVNPPEYLGPVKADLLNHIDGSWRIVLTNNHLREDLSNLPSGLNCYLEKNCLNIEVKENIQIEKPLVLYFMTSKDASGHLSKIKLELKISTSSFLSILEKHIHLGDKKDCYGLDCESFILVEKNAHLQFVRYWHGGENSLFTTRLSAKLQRDARLNSFTMTKACKYSHHQIDIKIPDTGAYAQIYGLYKLHKKQQADHFSLIEHQASHTRSDQLFKGILQDESRGMFQGDINIHPHASSVDANQLNKNLLLGKKAHALSRPELNIAMDDVKCTHGVTVGQLMEEEGFYLESRGIKKERTKEILLQAFAQDVLFKIPQDAIRRHLLETLEESC